MRETEGESGPEGSARTAPGRAEAAKVPIDVREGHDVDLEQLARLRATAGWADKSRELLQQQVQGARWVVSAWQGARMVGFARAISDGVTNGYISTVVVDTEYRGQGLGRRLIDRLVAGRSGIRWVLHSRADAIGFYRRIGFEPAPDMYWRDR